MKITNKLKAEILSVYNAYWDNYLHGDVEAMTVLLADEYTQVGSADTEVFYTKKDAVNFLYETIDQVAGKLEMRNRSTRLEQQDNLILIHELCDLYVLADDKWVFYAKARASTLMQKKKEGWKFIHQHSSFPDARTNDGENIAIDKIAEENRELREAVKRRTVELEQKNRELEIETTLEKVRTIAMGMREPADMLDVCKTISFQLQSLGVKEIRNVQTAIFYEQRGTYMNYEYYAKHDKTFITETVYTNNKIHNEFATKMLKGKGETFITHIKGDEVKNWIAYQKTTNVFIDKYLETASSLNYYWFSLGPVALGISTYIALTENEINLFKRFLKVFELAYQRYLDIEKAEAQAREAQIEASLERVRAVAMSMNRSEDLLSICEVAFTEFKKLGFNNLRNAIIHILNDEKGSFLDYDYSDYQGGGTNNISYTSHPIVENYLKQIKKADDAFAEVVIGRNQLDGWKDFRRRSGQLDDPRLDKIPALYYYLYSIGVGDIGISTFKPIEKDQLDILKRFRNVFNLSYQRYSDIAQAEALAREAKIEAALEKVRAVAMSMNKPDDLLNVCEVLSKEFHKLGFDEIRNAMINIHNDDKKTFLNYDYSDEIGKSITPLFYNIHPVIEKQIKQIRSANDAFSETVFKGKDLESWKEFRKSRGEKDDPRINNITALYYYFYSIGTGSIGISTFSSINEEKLELLKRFRNVFSLSYQRYSDIALAEAQAREAQIELALERVRARTMAMQKSDELAETAYVLFQQFKELEQEPDQFTIGIINEAEHVIEFWHTWMGNQLDAKVNLSMDEPHVANRIYKSWKKQDKSAIIDISGKELREYNAYRKARLTEAHVNLGAGFLDTEERRIIYFACFSRGIISISTHEQSPAETIPLLERFAGVFEQTYTRFLDLQKAEGQARESQIELALERVRARTMAMQNSNELVDTSTVLFHQLKILGVDSIRTGVATMDKENETVEVWSTSGMSGNFEKKILGVVPANVHPMFTGIFISWKNKEPYFAYELKGDELKKYYKTLSSYLSYPEQEEFNKREIIYTFFFPEGSLNVVSHNRLTEEECALVIRFAKVFGLVYTRFLDLQKAEAQAREAQIELALERVRARTMAMQKSEELKEVIQVVYEQFVHLNILVEHAGFVMDYKARDDYNIWIADPLGVPSQVTVPYFDSVYYNRFNEAKEKGEDFFATNLSFEEKNRFYQKLFEYVPGLPEKAKEFYFSCAGLAGSTVLLDNVCLYIENFSGTPYTDEENNTLMRFGKVFQQTYTRFLDLQKAEAQAREAQIEAALERVRSRAMAMHSSEDLAVTVDTFFSELNGLKVTPHRCGMGTIDEQSKIVAIHATTFTHENEIKKIKGNLKLSGHPVLDSIFDNWKLQKEYHPVLHGNEIIEYYKVMNPQVTFPDFASDETQYGYYFFFKEGGVFAWTDTELAEADLQIFRRYTSVLSLTYRRYMDLKEAEAQAREAKIEAALERVRAKAMAMHTSTDLSNTMGVLFTELPKLGISSLRCGVVLLSKNSKRGVFYAAATTSDSDSFTMIGAGDMAEHPVFMKQYENWLNNENYFTSLSDEDLHSYYKAIFARLSIPYVPKEHEVQTEYGYYFAFSEGMFYAWSEKSYSEDEINILNRFKAILDLTFRRYLDLQKAEAQAREAKIEVSLERVRSKAMAMHSPNDLSETVNVFFKELKTLGIIPIRCGVGQIDEATRTTSLTTTTSSQQGDSFQVIGKIKQTGHPVLDGIFENWKFQKEYHPVLEGEDIKSYYNVMNAQIGYPEYPEGVTQYGNCFFFKEGFVFAWTESKLSEEELQIFRRFTSVLSLTYRRYIDLKEAEVRAFEAVRQASLDRVRAEIASMRSTEDLNHITPIIWRELKTLEVPFFRCGVFIVDEANSKVQVYLTTPDGRSLGVLNFPIDSNELTSNTVEYWKKKKVYKEHWNKEQFIKWTMSMIEQGQVQNAETYQGSANPPDSLDLHFVPFTQGMLYVGDTSPLAEDKLQLVKTLAEAFSIAYARYEDFQRLEAAKVEVESAFGELDVLSKELKIKNEELEIENRRKALELEEARQLQLSMLPKELPKLPHLDIAVYMKTATEVGGDYYDFNVDTDGTLTFAIGDATGHGMKAGIIVSMVKALFSSGESTLDIKTFFKQSSDTLKGIELGRLMMAFMMLKINSNKVEFANAGMPPIFIYRKESNAVEEVMSHGMPLGALKDFPYEIKEMDISSGDTILLLSDGLPELKNEKNEQYNYTRVKEVFNETAEKSPDEIVDYLKDSATQWINGIESDDDVTFVVIKVK